MATVEPTQPARGSSRIVTKTQGNFEYAAFELLREAALLVYLLVQGIRSEPFKRNEAIRRGLIKRLSLLTKSLLSDIDGNSGYQQEAIARQLVEAAANYYYLAEDDGSGARYDAYVLSTLAEEKANLAIVADQINERGGDPIPIEKRMRRSIERMATAAGFDYDSVPGRGRTGWPKAIDRLALLSPVAYMPYRTGSNAIHSGWTALLLRDLNPVEGGFDLDNHPSPAVQPMTAAGLIAAETASNYLEIDGIEIERQFFEARLADVAERIRELDAAHELFMQTIEAGNAGDS